MLISRVKMMRKHNLEITDDCAKQIRWCTTILQNMLYLCLLIAADNMTSSNKQLYLPMARCLIPSSANRWSKNGPKQSQWLDSMEGQNSKRLTWCPPKSSFSLAASNSGRNCSSQKLSQTESLGRRNNMAMEATIG